METGRKIFRVILRSNHATFNNDGSLSDKKDSIKFSGDGEYINERVFGVDVHTTKKRIKTYNPDAVSQIGLSLSVYLEYTGKSEEEVFYSGEIHIWEDTIRTRLFPVNDIVVLRNNGTTIENVTSLVSIDKINGLVTIPQVESDGIFSLIYTQKRFSKVEEKDLVLPVSDKFGISVIQI